MTEQWLRIEYLLRQRTNAILARAKYEDEIWECLKKLRKFLSPQEYALLVLRYKHFYTIDDCANAWALSTERIRELEKHIIEKLKNENQAS